MYSGAAALHFAIGLIVGAPLLYAAASKLLDPSRFAKAIPRFGLGFLAPEPTRARLVGVLELACGAGLLAVPLPVTGVTTGLLYLGFAALLFRARLRGTTGECGCFGALASRIDAASIVRNLVLALGSFSVAYLRESGQLVPYEPGLAAALVAVFTVGAATTDTILEIRQRSAGTR
jgi:hypothetical protein